MNLIFLFGTCTVSRCVYMWELWGLLVLVCFSLSVYTPLQGVEGYYTWVTRRPVCWWKCVSLTPSSSSHQHKNVLHMIPMKSRMCMADSISVMPSLGFTWLQKWLHIDAHRESCCLKLLLQFSSIWVLCVILNSCDKVGIWGTYSSHSVIALVATISEWN